MRPEGNNPLDLNNLPEDYTRDGKQLSEDTSSSAGGGYRKKKSGAAAKDGSGGGGGDIDQGKVYECRFCSLKFCKSQALGGHMNRHRQERETETLNKARQLVFSNDLAPGHLGYVSGGGGGGGGQPMSHSHMGEAFRSMYPTTTRLFPNTPPLMPPPPPQPPYMYPSPPRLISFHSQYPPPPPPPQGSDYFMGHVFSEGNYTCVGAPVGPAGGAGGGGGGGSVSSSSLNSQEEGMSWSRR